MKKHVILMLLSLPLFSQVKIEVLDSSRYLKERHTKIDSYEGYTLAIGNVLLNNCPFSQSLNNSYTQKRVYFCDMNIEPAYYTSKFNNVVILKNSSLIVDDSLKVYKSIDKGNTWQIEREKSNLDNYSGDIVKDIFRKYALLTENKSATIYNDLEQKWTKIVLPSQIYPLEIYNGGILDENNYLLSARFDTITSFPIISQSIIVNKMGKIFIKYFPNIRFINFKILNNKIFGIGKIRNIQDSSVLKTSLFVSDDFGESWYETNVFDSYPSYVVFGNIEFYDEKVGIITGSDGEWLHTIDGGINWIKGENYLKSNKLDFAHLRCAFLEKNKLICTTSQIGMIFTIEFPLSSVENEPNGITNVTQSTHIELYDILGRSIATFQSYEKLKAEIENYPPPHLIKWRDEKGIYHFEKIK